MPETKAANLIVPEVWADMSQAKFVGTVRVGGSSAVMRDNTLVGQPGDSISFPKWGALGELDELTEAVAMATTVMSQTSSKATIKEAGKAVEISDNAMLNALGDPRAEAQRQFGILAARKVDADLIAQAQADETAAGGGNPYRYTATETALSWGVINHAIALFGDEFDPAEFAGIFINSAQRTQAWDDPQFTDASKLGGSIPVTTGMIGAIAGMPVVVTDRVAAGKFLILKKNSLGLLYKRAPIVEYDRDILKRTNVITTNVHYAVKRLDDRGVCVGTLATP
ncbi:major capsid protein [Streptomyces phage Cumberbatch]|uniref:Major capsid protein n=3 Tax=Ignaciovirus TaxID=3152509 RepID=A0A7D5JKA8_9CAUD|nr:major capsid protein [Streptomyces phage Eklok]YP_010756244.1 major capsid protein [Streptomyces phage AxeJC]YP_010756418.1 major capsid protein [Streptomyces phage Cumberbatch]QKN87650.1 major capsid protein [Streptomyces phage Cumberbatch]QLF83194.1 major capsid protein [Streptomyces phage Eklok]URC17930.1 major capsid protein [Streptomyces phage AxeJC]